MGVDVEMLRSLVAAFNSHDLDAVMAFFSEEPLLEMPRGPSPWGTRAVGREEVRRQLATRFEGLPDAHWGGDSHVACGDRGFSEWTLTGTTLSGERIEVRGCDLFEFDGDKIRRKDSYWKIVDRS